MKQFFLSMTLFLPLVTCFAQNEAKFTAEVSNDSILLGNAFEVIFTLENARGTNFQMPDFSDFLVVGGPNQSSSFSMMNGEVTQSVSYSYFLEPKDVGNFYIEPASVEAADMVLETQPLEIIVVPNPDGIIQQPKRRGQEWGDDFFKRDFDFGFPAVPKPPSSPETPKKKKKKRKTFRL